MNIDTGKEWREALRLAIANIGAGRGEYRLMDDGEIAGVGKCLPVKINADFIWKIDRIAERSNDATIYSEHFNIREGRYKMRLRCDWRFDNDREVRLYLCIYHGKNDRRLEWPYDKHVTVTITNPQSPHMHRAVTNQCVIVKPSIYHEYLSIPFTFDYTDLSDAGLLLGDHMVVNYAVNDQ